MSAFTTIFERVAGNLLSVDVSATFASNIPSNIATCEYPFKHTTGTIGLNVGLTIMVTGPCETYLD